MERNKVTSKNLKETVISIDEQIKEKLKCYSGHFGKKYAYQTRSEVYDFCGKVYVFPTEEITPYITSHAILSVQEVCNEQFDKESIFFGIEIYTHFSEEKNELIKMPAISVSVIVKEK